MSVCKGSPPCTDEIGEKGKVFMEIKTEKRMVEVLDTTYVAVDGKEFKSESLCLEYEERLKRDSLEEKADKLIINKLDDTYPLDTDAQYINDNHCYTWYQVNNEDDYNIINGLYNNDIRKPKAYPDIVCVEDDTYNSVWTYWLSDMKQATITFWKNFGYEIEFKVVKEI